MVNKIENWILLVLLLMVFVSIGFSSVHGLIVCSCLFLAILSKDLVVMTYKMLKHIFLAVRRKLNAKE